MVTYGEILKTIYVTCDTGLFPNITEESISRDCIGYNSRKEVSHSRETDI